MSFWKDKEGNELTSKEFFARWKEGIEGITPEQKVKSQIWGYYITIIGLLCGVVVSIITLDRLWWLMIILIGGLVINIVQVLGLYQQMLIFKKLNEHAVKSW